MYEDSTDLRYYIALLLRRWHWIFLGGLLAALAALGVTLLQPDSYEATAAVAVVRSRTNVTFDDRIETLDDYELSGARLAADRLDALLALASSNEVVRQVLDEVGDQLPAEARRTGAVRNMVDSRLTGDLIEFTVRHEDPEIAAAVVNSWAQAYARHANQVYGGSDSDVELVATQVVAARETYESAQQALQAFLADKEVLELTRTLERELAVRRDLLSAYQQSRVAIETNDANTNRQLLNNYYAELNQIERWLADAQTLQEQVSGRSGSFASSLGDALALIMLRSQVYGGQAPVDLQLDLANAEIEAVTAADVDNLVEVLETRREATEERIAALTAALGTDEAGATSLAGHPLTERIETLTDEVIGLETQLESERAARAAQRQELEATRDRAWMAYQALTDQQLEMEIQAESAGTEVRVADLAVVPESPVGEGLLLNTILAGMIGLMAAFGVVFFREWWYADERFSVQDAEEKSEDSDYFPEGTEESRSVRDGQQRVADTGV